MVGTKRSKGDRFTISDGTHTISPGKSIGILTNPSLPLPQRFEEDDNVDTNAISGARDAKPTVSIRSTVHVAACTRIGQGAEIFLRNGSMQMLSTSKFRFGLRRKNKRSERRMRFMRVMKKSGREGACTFSELLF
uniref:Uncharacterized protein n=1 Tax=Brassica campestris TaxID=3711 RepID=A0A3P6D383_BRACM|nr:unnamed protein product [Brassica rapa]